MSVPIRGGKSKPVKEAFYVRVATGDGTVSFFNASAYVGKQMPYQKPQATCAMRIEDNTVAFSLLHPTKKAAQMIAAANIVMPRGPLQRLIRRAKEIQIEPGQLVLEMEDTFYRLVYTMDDNGWASIETAPEQEDVSFDLPPRGVQLSLYLKSPKVDRVLAVSFIGHLGKPSTPETIVRAAAMVLNSISTLVEFRLLSGIERAKLPAAPSKWANRPPSRKPEDRVFFELTVNMFTTEMTPVKSGKVVVEIDVDHASPDTGHLAYTLTPEEGIAEEFGAYRDMTIGAITAGLGHELGPELSDILLDVVLQEVNAGDLERLRWAAARILGIDVTTREFRITSVAAEPEAAPEPVPAA